jgi:hypothetical protein
MIGPTVKDAPRRLPTLARTPIFLNILMALPLYATKRAYFGWVSRSDSWYFCRRVPSATFEGQPGSKLPQSSSGGPILSPGL